MCHCLKLIHVHSFVHVWKIKTLHHLIFIIVTVEEVGLLEQFFSTSNCQGKENTTVEKVYKREMANLQSRSDSPSQDNTDDFGGFTLFADNSFPEKTVKKLDSLDELPEKTQADSTIKRKRSSSTSSDQSSSGSSTSEVEEMFSFNELPLSKWIVNSCSRMGMKKPTPIQQACIPPILKVSAL